MLTICLDPNVNEGKKLDINLAASIQLKNMCERYWRYKDFEMGNKILIHEDEKNYVRENLVKVLGQSCTKQVLKQIVAAVRYVGEIDFPQQWPQALDDCKTLMGSDSEEAIYSGLCVLKSLIARFEFEFEERRGDLHLIADDVFPKLEEMYQMLIENQTEVALRIKNKIMRVLYMCNQLILCKRYRDIDNLEILLSMMYSEYEQQIDPELIKKCDDPDVIVQRAKNPAWKLKAVIMRFLFRIFQKHGNPQYAEEELMHVSEYILNTHNKRIMELGMNVVSSSLENYVSNRTLAYAIKTLNQASKNPNTINDLLPHMGKILKEYCIPLIFLTPTDEQDYVENPIEFARKEFCVMDNLLDPKSAALDMVLYFATYMSEGADKPDYLEEFLGYCIENLNEYSNMDQPDPKIKEALLHAISLLADTIKDYDDMVNDFDDFMIRQVLPELSSEIGYMKYRALNFYGEFARINFSTEHIQKASERMFELLDDEDLPVRVAAATNFYKFIRIESIQTAFEPHIGTILKHYLKLMSEIEQEELVSALEDIVCTYDDKIGPYATELAE